MKGMPDPNPPSVRIQVIYKGRTEEVSGDPEEPILGAVLEHGILVPFSCQTGTCLACNAILLEGEVKMKDSPALSQGSKEQGVILTCSAYPRSEKIRISYDD